MSDLATAIEAEAAHRAEVAAAAPSVEPITAIIPVGPVPITAACAMWRAWWEDRDMWDGAACYVDRDTALTHAAIDYVGEEYGWPHPEDEDDEQPTPGVLVWTWEHGAWHLSDGGAATLVQVYEERVYGPTGTPKPSRFTATPAQIDAFLRTHFCEDRIQLYQWAIGDAAAHEAAEEIRTHAQAKYDRDFSDNRIFHLNGSKRSADLIDPAKGGGHYPSVLVDFARRAAAADAGTVDGIRPHRPVTPEQDAQMKRAAEQLEKDNPMTPERAVEMLYGQSAAVPGSTGGE